MSGGWRSRLLTGRVSHRRRMPTAHAFAYRLFMLRLDLDELAALDARSRVFGTRPWRLVRLDAADFLGVPSVPGRPAAAAAAALRAAAVEVLRGAGVTAAIGRIDLVAHARLAGYVFNPVAFFVCHDAASGAPVAVVADVRNTYGERHAYVVPVAGPGGRGVWVEKKVFHVSPFFTLDGSYRFAFTFAGDDLDVRIDLLRDGRPVFLSRLCLTAAPLTDGGLVAALARWPAMTLQVTAAIHWEALRLWRKGLVFHPKPAHDPARARATRP